MKKFFSEFLPISAFQNLAFEYLELFPQMVPQQLTK